MIIGSYALKNHYPDFPRELKDCDVVEKLIFNNNFSTDLKIEWLKNDVLKERYKNNKSTIISKEDLLTLKLSHSFWSLPNNSWKKHVWDIQFLVEKGVQYDEKLFWELFYYWETIHGRRKASDLEMSSEKFFDNALNFPIEHDRIHEVLIEHSYFNGQKFPTYTKILKEGAEVDVCMEKFKQLSEQEKFNVVFEEVAVMMIEDRFPQKWWWKRKYEAMLKKFIISHCKVEEGVWILLNHKKLLTEIPFNPEEFLLTKLNLK